MKGLSSNQFSWKKHILFVVFRDCYFPCPSREYLIQASTATGIAINNVSGASQQVNIPVVVRDDSGTQIALDTLTFAANGDSAFTLVRDKYPQTANLRGTLEFDAPVGVQIGIIGIRTPPGSHLYLAASAGQIGNRNGT